MAPNGVQNGPSEGPLTRARFLSKTGRKTVLKTAHLEAIWGTPEQPI